jgi:magnesium chelatase family protein
MNILITGSMGNIGTSTLTALQGRGHCITCFDQPTLTNRRLAKRLPSILPPLNLHEALETTKIHSVAGRLKSNSSLLYSRPFRSPHHTISDIIVLM